MSKSNRVKIDLPTQLKVVFGGFSYTMYLQSGQEPEQRVSNCLVYKLSRPYRDELEKQSKSLGAHLDRPDHNMRVIIPVKEMPF